MTDNPDDPIFTDPTPIALFPVRLETRFFPGSTHAWELRIRIYPDTISANAHDPRISDIELRAGKQFVEDTWRSGPDVARRRDAYARLCDRVGEPRAAYLAATIVPTNPGDRPAAALDPDAALPTLPQYGALPTRGSDELIAPTAMLLPDRWLATAYSYETGPDGTRQLVVVGQAFGSRIAPSLALGISSDDQPTTDSPTDLRLGARLAWLADFAAAESAGMALRVAVTTDQLARVVVVGLRESASPSDGAAAITDWLTTQRYTHGVACLPPGTRTRNTGDAHSDHTRAPTIHDVAFATERGAPLYTADASCAGGDLARALGIESDAFAHVAGADATRDAAAADMVTALWPVTWGYYLEQMMKPLQATAPEIISADGIDAARRHAMAFLRPGGALSGLRVGDSAYGVLPATSWTRYSGSDSCTTGIARVLAGMRPIWDRASQRVPRLTGPPSEETLLQIIRQAPSSLAFAAAPVRGPEFFSLLGQVLGPFLLPNWLDLRGLVSDAVLAKIGVSTRPRLAATTSEAGTRGFIVLDAPLVAAQPSETSPLAGKENYIAWILQAGYSALRDETFTTAPTYAGDPQLLLYKLLRHAVLRTYVRDAERRLPVFLPFVDAEFLLVTTKHPTVDMFVHPYAGLSQAAFAAPLGATPLGASSELNEMRDALLRLATRPTAELERLATETLDAASHRIDAWVSSLANARLGEVRARTPTGVRIGAYGWLDGVSRSAGSPGDTTAQPVVDPANQGYLLAPSLAQASTAAVLRSGQLAHDAALDAMEFDLSPARVRTAQRILAGVRTGQPLGALLGYELERALHDAGLDRYIAPLRAACPLVAGKGNGGAGPVTQLAAANVVDGVSLHQMLQTGALPFGTTLPAVGTPGYTALTARLAVLEDAYAAVADVLTAESVHHLVRGDAQRSVAALDPISAGEAIPARLDFAATPRTGVTVAHRVIVDLAGEPQAKWAPASDGFRALQVRAAVDPELDAWVGRWLGDPGKVRCTVTRADGTDSREITIDKLGLSPLDVLALASVGEGGDFTRIVLARAAQGKLVPSATTAVLDLGRKPAWDASVVDVPTLLATARRIAALIGNARAANARDFMAPGTGTVAAATTTGVDAADLEKRTTVAVTALESLVADAEAAAAPHAAIAVQTAWLWRAAYLGIPGAVPFDDEPHLGTRVTAVRASVAARAAALARVGTVAESDPPDARVANALARLAAVLGPGLRAVPRFTTTNTADVQDGFGVVPGAPLDVVTWLQRASRVQPGCARLVRAALACEAVSGGTLLTPRVAQVPFRPGDGWVGAVATARSGTMSLVIVGGTAGNPTAIPSAGLLLDQWNEVLPQPKEVAAAALHYEAPPARAPHAILIAVPPNLLTAWSYTDVRLVVNDTLDLAMCRAVEQTALFAPTGDPHALNLSQYLPAIYLANNATHDTVSTSFGPKPQGS